MPAPSSARQAGRAEGDQQRLSTLETRSSRSCSRPPRRRAPRRPTAALAGLSRGADRRGRGAAKDRKARAMCCRCRTRRSSRCSASLTSQRRASSCSKQASTRAEKGDANDTRDDRQRAGPAARREGGAARLSELRGLRALGPDGEERRPRVGFIDQLAPATRRKERQRGGRDPGGGPGRRARTSSSSPGTGTSIPSRSARQRYDSRSGRAEALFRAQQGAPGRRLLRRQPALRHHLQGAARTSRSISPDMRVFEVLRQGRLAAGPHVFRLLQARQQVGRRLDEQLRRPVEAARHQAGGLQRRRTSPSRRRASRR